MSNTELERGFAEVRNTPIDIARLQLNTYNRIYAEVCKMPVIDTHEHLSWNGDNINPSDADVLAEYLIHYMSSDIRSAGLSNADFEKVVNRETDIMERWNIVEPYWEFARYTGYGRALDIAVKGIYGINGVNRDTIVELNRVFRENHTAGHYTRVLKDLCNIEVSLLDDWTWATEPVTSPLFKRAWQPTPLITPNDEVLKGFNSLDDWLNHMETQLDKQLEFNGTRFIKTAIAYSRTLKFDKVDYNVAKEQFNTALETKWFQKELQDYCMHHLMKLANDRNLTVQFHTGLLEGNGNTLSNSDPSLLNNLFLEYPNVDFDLFHISYPYQNIAAALCKMFPNVFIDMCWAHIMSPNASVLALSEFLDAVPYNKISAFGGDYCFVDGVYGHLYLARENVSKTLADKVNQGIFSEDKAIEIAHALFYDNPKRIFKL
jgi:Predicted metal-dependent hydrolase of the TIM-barrel fold